MCVFDNLLIRFTFRQSKFRGRGARVVAFEAVHADIKCRAMIDRPVPCLWGEKSNETLHGVIHTHTDGKKNPSVISLSMNKLWRCVNEFEQSCKSDSRRVLTDYRCLSPWVIDCRRSYLIQEQDTKKIVLSPHIHGGSSLLLFARLPRISLHCFASSRCFATIQC